MFCTLLKRNSPCLQVTHYEQLPQCMWIRGLCSSLCTEKQEVRDDGTGEGRKDEGISDAPHLMRSEESEWV